MLRPAALMACVLIVSPLRADVALPPRPPPPPPPPVPPVVAPVETVAAGAALAATVAAGGLWLVRWGRWSSNPPGGTA